MKCKLIAGRLKAPNLRVTFKSSSSAILITLNYKVAPALQLIIESHLNAAAS